MIYCSLNTLKAGPTFYNHLLTVIFILQFKCGMFPTAVGALVQEMLLRVMSEGRDNKIEVHGQVDWRICCTKLKNVRGTSCDSKRIVASI